MFKGNMVKGWLVIGGELEKGDIGRGECVGKWKELSVVEEGMVDVGVVECGYKDGGGAVIMRDVVDGIGAARGEEMEEGVCGLLRRDGGWEE